MNYSKLKHLKNTLMAIRSNHEMNTRHAINMSSADESTKVLVRKMSDCNNAYNNQIESLIIEILNAIEE